MTNHSSFELENTGPPGFLTFVMALTTLSAPSVKKWSLDEKGKKFCESGKKGKRKNGGRVQRKLADFLEGLLGYLDFLKLLPRLGYYRTN